MEHVEEVKDELLISGAFSDRLLLENIDKVNFASSATVKDRTMSDHILPYILCIGTHEGLRLYP